ncbi:dynein regulatory complex subunit 3 [Salarias fasciatus]|uniref:dynein regulatory complex subunit 3 n=1 Tax=Salarias fasciatus TaxID=181472 RepID=UPI001176721C|nr:dynein regulatory complex subunit 3 [Salarias fasciatus]
MYKDPNKSKQWGMNEMILQIIKEQVTDDEAAPPVESSDVLHLRLEYRNIRHIECLWDFTSLTRLDLNNNLIDKIQGLDHLINLKWLNLSFNRIKKIEGFQSLQKLELLNLSDNKISVIESLDAIENLTHFFLSNNCLEQLDNVLYLRRFKNIFAITLFGNPAVDDDNYHSFMAAHFPNLILLDSIVIDENTRNEASTKYQYVLDKMRNEEVEIQKAEEDQQRQEAELKLHKDAFVEFLNGPGLFGSMFEDDPEKETLHCAPGVDALQETFKCQMEALCTQLFETGLAEHKRRESEGNSFRSGQSEVVTHYQQKQSQILETFEQEHKKRITEMQKLSDPDTLLLKISHCSDEINYLYKSLLTLEFKMARQVEKSIKEFDSSISEMVANFIDTAEGIFVQCRDLEDNYYQKAREAALETVAKVANDAQDEDMPYDVLMFFTDKDAVLDALTTGHDNHIVKINDRETRLVTDINVWKLTLIKEIQDRELYLKRIHISDFIKYRDYLMEQLEEFQ